MSTRPVLHDPSAESEASAQARALAHVLQTGLDAEDADRYDSRFAADILWGSPKGATVSGYDSLNAIHRELMSARVAPRSRFEVVSARTPAPGVVVTQIRRRALDPEGFSELAMYVLVEREGRWWLAAAQNTPVAR
ncbi:SgcJ/EcaC family oxidoreductase [Nocardia takedensis]